MLLRDKEFLELVNTTIDIKLNEIGGNARLKLDTLKCVIRGEAVKYGARKKREREKEKRDIQANLQKAIDKKDDIKADSLRVKLELCLENEAKVKLNEILVEDLGQKPCERLMKI